MKRILVCLTFAVALGLHSVLAIPAHRGTAKMAQPDGTTLTISLHGDEYLHFYTTVDGYSIVKDADNRYVYAELKDGNLQPTSMVAHDANERSAHEQAYLSGVKKYLAPKMTQAVSEEMNHEMNRRSMARQKAMNRAPRYDYNNFHGLIVLVDYNDKSFSRSDIASIVNGFANMENYTGFSSQDPFTGSVRDYFNDVSGGVFQPQFDVVGPVTVNRSQYYANGSQNGAQLTYEAINAVDALVNFNDYDGDNDGVVDMVYFIFAGLGSNIPVNDRRLLWPHAGMIHNPQTYSLVWKDGLQLGRYACSTELIPTNNGTILDGIGTICHEFSHVLGLPDTYDTDYEESGGTSHDPGEWDLMASGSYLNNSRTPVSYTLYERYAVGFATPEVINAEGQYTLQNVSTNTGFRLNTRQNKEYFLLENHQKSKWDKYAPGHGMLVFRVDSTRTNVWTNNVINTNPAHNYFELLRAGGSKSGDNASDAFPGTKKVTRLDNNTSPANLKTWAGKESVWGLDNIKEINGVITFNVIDVNVLTSVKVQDTLKLSVGVSSPLVVERYPESAPYTFEWKSDNEAVATVDDQGVVKGVSVGTANITLKANNNDQLKAICKVTVTDMSDYASIAGLIASANDVAGRLQLNDAQVLFVHNSNLYVRDATGSVVLTNLGLNVKANDLLNGNMVGTRVIFNEIVNMQGISGIDYSETIHVSQGSAAKPHVVTVDQVSSALYSDLITITGAEMQSTTVESLRGVFVISDSLCIRIFNTFGLGKDELTMPKSYAGKEFDLTGILMNTESNGKLIMELALVTSPVESSLNSIATYDVSDASQPVTIYTLDGRKVSAYSKPGIFIVKQGNKKKKVLVK